MRNLKDIPTEGLRNCLETLNEIENTCFVKLTFIHEHINEKILSEIKLSIRTITKEIQNRELNLIKSIVETFREPL